MTSIPTPNPHMHGKIKHSKLGAQDGVEAEAKAKAKHMNGAGRNTNEPRFKLIHIDDLVLDDEPVWLIDEILPAGPALAIVFGWPKSGKTFLVSSALYHVAMERPYCGRAVQKGVVVYVTSEGVRGFHRRMMAMRQYLKPETVKVPKVPFYVVNTMPNLGEKSGDAQLLATLIRNAVPNDVPIAAVAIDTLRRATPGKSEVSPEDMGVFVDNCGIIQNTLNCLVVAVHHSPRSNDARISGSNSIDAAGDALLSTVMDKQTGISTATVEDLKDGESGLTWQFEVVKKDFQDRNQKHGCAGVCATISNPTRPDGSATKRNQNLTPVEMRMHTILCDCITDHGELVSGAPDVPVGTKAVTREQLNKYAKRKGFYDAAKPNVFRSMVSKYLNHLAGKNIIGLTDEHAWLPKI